MVDLSGACNGFLKKLFQQYSSKKKRKAVPVTGRGGP
jgi:hypothetical protein